MSGDGMIAARPEGMPDARDPGPETVPFVVGHMNVRGEWCVLLMLPVPGAVPDQWALSTDEAEKLAWGLLDYAKLIRDKLGLATGVPYPGGPTAALHEGGA